MACETFQNERRNMTISVIVLGMTLFVVFLAYFAFSESHNDPNLSTVQFAAIVSLRFLSSSSSNKRANHSIFLEFVVQSCIGFSAWRTCTNRNLSK